MIRMKLPCLAAMLMLAGCTIPGPPVDKQWEESRRLSDEYEGIETRIAGQVDQEVWAVRDGKTTADEARARINSRLQERAALEAADKEAADVHRRVAMESATPEVRDAISKQGIVAGMTEAEVLASWGKPNTVFKSGGLGPSSSQWVYDHGSFLDRSDYLYFNNGRLIYWTLQR